MSFAPLGNLEPVAVPQLSVKSSVVPCGVSIPWTKEPLDTSLILRCLGFLLVGFLAVTLKMQLRCDPRPQDWSFSQERLVYVTYIGREVMVKFCSKGSLRKICMFRIPITIFKIYMHVTDSLSWRNSENFRRTLLKFQITRYSSDN